MPRRNVTSRRQDLYNQILGATNCTTLACLRSLPAPALALANNYLISEVPSGGGGGSLGPGIGFAPVVDGDYVPDAPLLLFEQGRFHKEVKSVIAANAANDGMGLGPDSDMPAGFPNIVRMVFPGADNATVERIKALFPVAPGEPPEKLA